MIVNLIAKSSGTLVQNNCSVLLPTLPSFHTIVRTPEVGTHGNDCVLGVHRAEIDANYVEAMLSAARRPSRQRAERYCFNALEPHWEYLGAIGWNHLFNSVRWLAKRRV